MKHYVQGDVLIEAISQLPTGLKTKKDKLLVRGEHSNHGHYATNNTDVLEDENGDLYLDVKADTAVKHLLIDSGVSTKEHEDIEIEKGYYKIIRQQEYDPYEKTITYVKD